MTVTKATNVVWHEHKVSRQERESLLGQKGVLIWFTGLSASGKSTVANEVASRLHKQGKLTYILDGDNIRHGLNKDLGFSPADREENIRRISEVGKLFADSGVVTLTAFISPYRKDRDFGRSLLEPGRFIEVFVKASIDTCKDRDPKGLYAKALRGEIAEFTGVTAPYEEPLQPEIVLDADVLTVEEEAEMIVSYLNEKGLLQG
ncbi:MAG TPA: adenylyl-sulfate kinase [Candidatus Aminicenantes bacterium]|nr:adenylyl-sulfate kinase [Candidatus Aminicenantes bacterium]HPB54615.1 adenylyl-sulfate kinase [Candidatus Aminicenantes bacterium]HPT00641.1 adenylyl-sulfate kinase [Candidatus Aminicenantes bacterium]